MWGIFLFISMASSVLAELTGLHICQEKESYKVNVTHYSLRNVTVRSYIWCLQVIPRCTIYKIQEINGTKIVEEDRVRLITTCCEGYMETPSGTKCIPSICRSCINGSCGDDGECDCKPGYQRPNCSEGCQDNHWGKNCSHECNCARGICNPISGDCACPHGWSGVRCEIPCTTGEIDDECPPQTDRSTMHICNPFTKKCTNLTTNGNEENYDYEEHGSLTETPNYKLLKNGMSQYGKAATLQKYHTFDQTTTKLNLATETLNSPVTKFIHQRKKSTSFPYSYFTTVSQLNILIDENEKPKKQVNVKKASSKIPTTLAAVHLDHTIEVTTITNQETTALNHNSMNMFNITVVTAHNFVRTDQNLLHNNEKRTDKENLKSNSPSLLPPNNSAHLEVVPHEQILNSGIYFTVILATLLTVLAIIIAAILLSFYSLRNKRQRMKIVTEHGNELGNTTVSVTTRSIFHTPLPDPPVFTNPVFTTPLEQNGRTFESHVICSMNIAKKTNPISVSEDLFYDHPTTSSVRTTSTIEPPCLEHKIQSDPIYDEIPCYKRPALKASSLREYNSESSTLYMNTNTS